MQQTTYDYIVIGKGLLGAAAARHLSSVSQRVALIGPDEPPNRAYHRGIFGSHYDEGRITRILDPNRIWALLAQRSIARYHEIEAHSGIAFYHEIGHLMVGPEPPHPEQYVERVQQVAADLGVVYETYTDVGLKDRFPYLAFAPASVGMYQAHDAGHVSPRSQVLAQATAAQKQGATLIREVAEALHPTSHGMEVRTREGHRYRAEKVLVATGGFSNAKHLLPQPLDITVNARTIVLMELDGADLERLRDMPSIIYKSRHPAGSCYILPPIRYPDDKYYVKIGGGYEDPTLHSLSALQEWFRGPGSETSARRLTELLYKIVPGLRPVSLRTESCVTTDTASKQVYADRLAGGRLGVLIGGNGSAAKSADEIGRLGALMMQHDDWVYDVEADHFRVHFTS